ncbi:MFS transporter [Actinoplanes sp. NPDC051851]|uniref:MFS transporter n=1 Tax=Actinoplanes sp. NPDC051851 TaxID=3154753 RepID=UPI00341875BF
MLGLAVALLPPLLVGLTLKLNDLDPDAVGGNLSIVLGVGAFFAFAANPIAGRLSDRTTSRFGMRKPWILVGTLGGYAGIVVIAVAPNLAMVVVGWACAQIAFNFAIAGLIAMLPDQVPTRIRGKVASAVGLGQNLAGVAATYLVALFPGSMQKALLPSLIGMVVLFAAVLPIRDRRRTEAPAEAFSLKTLFGSFVFDPRKHPDLGWAWLTRLLLVTTQITAINYLSVYLLTDFGVNADDLGDKVFEATLWNAAGIVVFTTALGLLSDRLGRRKPFVVLAAMIAVAGLSTIAFAPTFTVILVGEFVMGAGMGSFLAVELALITEVLPNAEDAGKDLGVINIAQALPQSVVPAVAPGLIAALGYAGFFLTGAGAGVLGALAITRVKSVK